MSQYAAVVLLAQPARYRIISASGHGTRLVFVAMVFPRMRLGAVAVEVPVKIVLIAEPARVNAVIAAPFRTAGNVLSAPAPVYWRPIAVLDTAAFFDCHPPPPPG